MATVYILSNQINNSYYIGCTENLDRRISEHNSGKTKSTKSYRPWVLEVAQEYKTLGEARKIELRLKNLKRKDYLDKIVKDKRILMAA